jgi:transcriptional coactivator HFI1/ADA1
VQLHNQLLASLLHNASSPLISNITMSPLTTGNKRRKGGINAPDFDSDPSYIEPRGSVQYWVMGMGGKERERVRRALEPGEADADGEAEAEPEPPRARKRKWSLSTASESAVPMLATCS